MSKNKKPIPVNHFGGEIDSGIVIERIAFNDLPDLGEWVQPERHDRHSFFLVEKGSVTIEIDFQKYIIKAPSIICMHPNQVHRIIAFKNMMVTACAINNENLNPDYLTLLDDISPAKPILLGLKSSALFLQAANLCLKFAEREKDKLYHSLLKDACNGLVGLILSQYAGQSLPSDKASRFNTVTKEFRETLEQNFTKLKRPAEYAGKMNVSPAYLNECVKNATGHSVSHHIQQRIILESKRLLYHADLSVKEIAFALGYDDYPYFSRLFTKVTGMTALAFRSKNRE